MKKLFSLFLILAPIASLAQSTSVHLKPEEKTCLACLNQFRVKLGLSPLALNPVLQKVAEDESAWMFSHHEMDAHHNQNGLGEFTDRILNSGYIPQFQSWAAGENVAQSFRSGREVCKLWILSPPHLHNILNPKFSEIGISMQGDDEPYEYWSNDFGNIGDSTAVSPVIRPAQVKEALQEIVGRLSEKSLEKIHVYNDQNQEVLDGGNP